MQLSWEDKNQFAENIAVTIRAAGMGSSVVRALSESPAGFGELLSLLAPEQTGQSGSMASSPQNQRGKESIFSQNVYGECESTELKCDSYMYGGS